MKWLLGVTLLALLFGMKDNAQTVLRLLTDMQLSYLLVLFLLAFLLHGVSAVKWGLLLRERGLSVPFPRLFGLYLIGTFFSNFMPSMVGGDLTRILLLGREIGSQSRSAASVILERFTGLVALVAMALGFSFANIRLLREPLIGLSVVAVAGACLALVLLIARPGWYRLLAGALSRFPFSAGVLSKAEILYDELRSYRKSPRVLVIALALSVVFYLLASMSVYYSCLAIGFEARYLDIALVTPIIFLVTIIPVSPNNIGWWEWCFSVLLVSVGAGMAEGIAAALTLRAVALVMAGAGGVLFLFERSERSSETT